MKCTIRLLALSLTATAPFSYSADLPDYYDYGFIGGSLVYGESVFLANEENASLSLEPNLFYNGKYGFVDGSLANLTLFHPWFGLSGQWRFAEVSQDFDKIPSGVDERKGNGELGITFGTVGARITYLHDVTNVHDGYEVQLHLSRSYATELPKLTLTPYVEVDYRDAKLSQHLYSVSPSESSRSRLPAFTAKSTWVYQAGLIGIYDLGNNWISIAKLELEHHDSTSRILQRDLGWAVTLGAAYTFNF
ncbi:MipA/OmpV family protein [Vibrio tarriae]|uniref:MipA/OmpV family protein n=1 Tax=Vibrio tarriae TaxID=2014742 RepID=UPI000DE4BD64|nr:MipA/OmpV family protein [Vibrio tarriae]RBM37309.1 MipA/OmpV family protein [Vibrio tarriae]